MNEQIVELLKQVGGIQYDEDGDELTPILVGKDLEKFAELIVAECIKLCEHNSNDDEYDQFDMGQSVKAENIKASIMKEFGVEE